MDDGLRATFTCPPANRDSPARVFSTDPMSEHSTLRAESASLMRINHVGEVCAQALYQGQALTSRSTSVRNEMQAAADEEIDHLNWCYQRIKQLNGRTSLLNPLWYLGSLALGIGAGFSW